MNVLDLLNKEISSVFNCDLKSKSQKLEFINSKYAFCQIARKELKINFKDIAIYLDQKHGTVMSKVKKFDGIYLSDKNFAKGYDTILENFTREKYKLKISKLKGNDLKEFLRNEIQFHSTKVIFLKEQLKRA